MILKRIIISLGAMLLVACTSQPYVIHTEVNEAKNQRVERVCTHKRALIPWYVGVAAGFFTFKYGEECHEEISPLSEPSKYAQQLQTQTNTQQPSSPPSVSAPGPAPEFVTKATPDQGETIKPGGINTDGRFIVFIDGTLLDTQTNLMWAAKDNGGDIDWQNAKNYCENYRSGGYTDWRMPTQNELAGLYNKDKPRLMACDTSYTNRVETALIDISCYYLWASETESSFYYNAWFVSFDEGTAKQMRTRDSDQAGQKYNPEWQSISRYVRAVRSLQQSNP